MRGLEAPCTPHSAGKRGAARAGGVHECSEPREREQRVACEGHLAGAAAAPVHVARRQPLHAVRQRATAHRAHSTERAAERIRNRPARGRCAANRAAATLQRRSIAAARRCLHVHQPRRGTRAASSAALRAAPYAGRCARQTFACVALQAPGTLPERGPASGGSQAQPDDELLTEQHKLVSACLTGAPSRLPIDALRTHQPPEPQDNTQHATEVRARPNCNALRCARRPLRLRGFEGSCGVRRTFSTHWARFWSLQSRQRPRTRPTRQRGCPSTAARALRERRVRGPRLMQTQLSRRALPCMSKATTTSWCALLVRVT